MRRNGCHFDMCNGLNMNKPTITKFILFCAAVIAVPQVSVKCEDQPFPELLGRDQSSIHIVAESISDTEGRETIEEYVDLIEGKNTFIRAGSMGYSINHLDGARNIMFHYKPYTCLTMTLEEIKVSGMEGIWKSKVYFGSGKATKTMYLFGVAAIWLEAQRRPKEFSNAKLIYSATKDVYNSAWKWVVNDEETYQRVHLYFVPGNVNTFGEYETRLDMIEFESMVTNKVTRTLNILEMSYDIEPYDTENLLQVPVGYGCIDKSVMEKSKIKYHDLSDFQLDDLLNTTHRIDLEVTYTNFGLDSSYQPVSKTVNVQLASHKPTDESGLGSVQSIRQRGVSHDIKTVTHQKLNAQYSIDYRTGNCIISHVKDESKVNERLLVKFSNEEELDPDLFDLHMLFGNYGGKEEDGYYFVKRTTSSDNIVHEYYELTLDRTGLNKVRFVRVYAQNEETGKLDLDHVTAYLFNENLDHIMASYQFNLIEVTPLANLVERAKLFDVSDECYLNNQNMQVNRDYAWFQLEYPLQSSLIPKLTNRGQEVKASVYDRLYSGTKLTFFRVPKIELFFTETGMTVRALMLDLPKLHILFKNNPKTRISSATKPEVEIDVEHCSELCRLSRCQVMSYCKQLHICSTLDDSTKIEIVMVPEEEGCTSYFAPEYYYKEGVSQLSLHGVVSKLQHEDYNVASLPKIPEELLSQNEDEVSQDTKDKMKEYYLTMMNKYISEDGSNPSMTFSMKVNGQLIILSPSKFLLEEDPMREFDLKHNDLDEYADVVQPFHQGLLMRKFSKSIMSPQLASQYRVNLFKGLIYDQCAMVCSDSRCSSFSYCEDSQECLITDIYSLSQLKDNNLVVEDAHCFISQRDFLSKFNKFPSIAQNFDPNNMKPNQNNKLIRNVVNPSECAHSCVTDSDLHCLSFDFCHSNGETLCIFYNDRHVHFASNDVSPSLMNNISKIQGRPADVPKFKCDHYSRSYLADFTRIENRRLKEEELAKLKTSSMEGVSVYHCAEHCANHLTDCSAFQFCIMHRESSTEGSLQLCVLIESPPKTDADGFRVMLNKTDGKVLKTGRFFVLDPECQVFSLRKDSTEAQVRELALAQVETTLSNHSNSVTTDGTHIFSYVLLYMGLTLVFTSLACTLLVVGHRNEYLRQKIERIQILLNMQLLQRQ